MTSQINPNNINGAYPVAGQDNNSQGFRDNFTNTGTNFQYAANEISDLQQKAIVNAQLIGGAVLTNQNNMLGSPLINGLISDFAAAAVPLGVVGGTVDINYQSGHYQTFTTNSAVTLGFTNFPPTGQMGIVTVQITVANTVHTLTLPSSVSVNADGIQGYNTANRTINFAAAGVYSFTFITSDGGATITINETNQQLRAFNGSGELLTASGQAMSLAVTTSRFATTGAWTATLAAGVAGQIKTLIMTGDGGDMVVTVPNAGWKNTFPFTNPISGTITFTSLGQGCTLRWAGLWYCVGNNGCVFA
jgi:hypothetical protein